MTKAYFTIEVDLPDGVTCEDFRFWAEHELRCAVGGTDADDPLRKLKRDKIIVRGVATPSIGSFYRTENYVKASDGYAVAKNRNNGEGPGNWVNMVANVRIDNTVDSFVIVPIDPKSNKLLWDRQWGPGVKRT